MKQLFIHWMERGFIPDWLISIGIRNLLAARVKSFESMPLEEGHEEKQRLIEELKSSPVAVHTGKANEQHYEVPAEFFQTVLGTHLKYSCCYWPKGVAALDEAEAAMLKLTCERAGLKDGMNILELGCGWGSLTLWMAQHYPNAAITAVSNSASQRVFILEQCKKRSFKNVHVITCDINEFDISQTFDRIVSVEMFEHVRNYQVLLERVSRWMKDDGKLFVHIFCHRDQPYTFETKDPSDWMGKYFFTGGIMPSDDLLLRFNKDVSLERQWRVDGRHYERTARAWLAKQDQAKTSILHSFENVYPEDEVYTWFVRWRVFFLACAELFGYRNGKEWWVSHYLFTKSDHVRSQ